jgi:hypothetical protein
MARNGTVEAAMGTAPHRPGRKIGQSGWETIPAAPRRWHSMARRAPQSHLTVTLSSWILVENSASDRFALAPRGPCPGRSSRVRDPTVDVSGRSSVPLDRRYGSDACSLARFPAPIASARVHVL